MFANHQPIISEYARAHEGAFARVGLLCILSARQPFFSVADQFTDVMRGDRRWLFDWKSRAWNEMHDQCMSRFARLEAIRQNSGPRMLEANLLAEVVSWHGFGLAKGGFLLQLTYGLVGCLDSRNIAQYGLAEPCNLPKTLSYRTRLKKCCEYVDLCYALGGSEVLWDEWCYGFEVEGRKAFEVSAEHCRILGLDPNVNETKIPF